MADRYQLQVGERSTPAAFGQAYGNNAAQIGGAISGLGKGLEGVGAWLQERQDKWDAATVMNAQTEFARRMSDYLDNPETGQTVKRKSGAARGLTDDTDAYADKTARDISAMLENDRQRAVFESGIGKAKMPYFKQASNYEARELETYRKQAFDANMSAANDMYLRGADSPQVRRQAVDMAANAIRSQYFGAPEEYIQRAIDETKSGMAAQWVVRVAQDDPISALAMLGDKELGILPETKGKLAAQIKPRAEIYEIQAIADRLILDYPRGDEEELYKYVREHYAGEKEEKILSAVKARVNERKITEDAGETALRKAQRGNYDNYVAGMVNGVFPTAEQIALDVDNGKLDPSHGWQLENMISTQATAAGTRKRLARDIPGWNSMESWKQDELVMQNMPDGPTKAEHEAMMNHLKDIALSSDVTDKEFEGEVKSALGNMRITRHEADEFLGARRKLKAEQKEFVSNVRGDLRANLSQLFNNKKGRTEGTNAAVAYFNEAVTQLDPNSSTYRKDVLSAMKDAMVKGVEVSGRKLTESDWIFWTKPTAFAQQYDILSSGIDTRIANTPEYEPRFTMDNLNLPETREAAALAGTGTGHVGQDFVGGGGTTVENGKYLAKGGRSKPHGGQDLAKPAGTPVTVPQGLEDVEMTVSGVGYDKTSGNKMHLTGEHNGHKFDIFMCHFQDDSIKVKNGQTVKAGDVLAKVGSTGRSSGAHLHIETKIDGKRVDPAKFYGILGLKQQEAKAAQLEQPQQAQPPVSGDIMPQAPVSGDVVPNWGSLSQEEADKLIEERFAEFSLD